MRRIAVALVWAGTVGGTAPAPLSAAEADPAAPSAATPPRARPAAVAAPRLGPEAGLRRIALAGRQRMLGERIAKAACFAGIGLEPDRHIQEMAVAADLFERSLAVLRAGDRTRGIRAAEDAETDQSLTRVAQIWEFYRPLVSEGTAMGLVERGQVAEMARLTRVLVAELDRTVSRVERVEAKRQVPLGRAIALGIAGRQLTLTQAMSKDICLIASGLGGEAPGRALSGAVGLFGASLSALSEGAPDLGIRPPASPAHGAKLAAVAELWAPLAPLYDTVAGGRTPGFVELVTIAAENERLLEAMSAAASPYETLDAAPKREAN